jgi:non-ribosomal peptide synthetase component F
VLGRVLQGFSTSFDASVEEVWMALGNGATLVVGTKDVMRSGPDFASHMRDLGVTCISTVPTLLSSLEHQHADLPAVRLVITGGEACSKELVARWAAPHRRFFNTYGPTEVCAGGLLYKRSRVMQDDVRTRLALSTFSTNCWCPACSLP